MDSWVPDRNNIKLYSYYLSSCSFRVRIAMNLKDIKYEYIPVDLTRDEQHDKSYSKMVNAMGQVPTLRIDGITLTQSIPILEYLEERDKAYGVRLLPDDIPSRSRVRQITEIINSGIHPVQTFNVRKRVIALRGEYQSLSPEEEQKFKVKWCQEVIETGFTAIEEILKQCAGIFCVGNKVSIADCCLVPQVFNAMYFGVNVEKYPNIHRIAINCMHTPAFIKAAPNNQPDAPKQSKL